MRTLVCVHSAAQPKTRVHDTVGPKGDGTADFPAGERCENTGVCNMQHSTKTGVHDTVGPMGDERADLPPGELSENTDVYNLEHRTKIRVHINYI